MPYGVFSQILAAALVVFLVWKTAKYIQWRMAVVRFVHHETDQLPHSTEREAQKSLKLAWELIARSVVATPKAKRAEMLATQAPIGSQASIMMFALMRALEAKDRGEITEDGIDGYVKIWTLAYSINPEKKDAV